MKKFVAAIAAASLLSTGAYAAGSFTQNFNVTVNLTAACRIQGGGPVSPLPVVDFGTYTAFTEPDKTIPASVGSTFYVECTRKLTAAGPTFTFDGTNGGNGVVAGLSYTVTVTKTDEGIGVDADPLTATAAVADVYKFALSGFMAGGQPGQGTGGATTALRTLTISY